jgi:hypothetical protein
VMAVVGQCVHKREWVREVWAENRKPKTELLGLDFARDIGNVGGGKWGEVDEWGLRGNGGCEVVGSQTRGGGGIGGRKLETEPLELDFGRAIEKNGSG